MTVETKTSIEPGDVLTVQIECSGCGSRAIRSVNDYRNDPAGCSNCGARWGHLSNEFRQLAQLLNHLRFFAAAKDLPFKLRFEIAEQKRKDQA